MKVKTNLSPKQLAHVAEKLQTLAENQYSALPIENPAETELLRRADNLFDQMLENLQQEISHVLLDKA